MSGLATPFLGAEMTRPDPPLAELTLASLRRSPERFSEVYEDNYGRVAGYVYRRVGDREVCEDIVSDIFLSALRGFRRARRGKAPVRYWLLRIATNRVNRWLRSERGRSVKLEPDSPELETSDENEQSSLKDEVRSALQALPPAGQAVLALHYLEGLSVSEVSGVLGCRPGTVKSRLSRARAQLAVELQRRRSM